MFKKELFTQKEILSFELRELFSSQGYSLYQMKTFEPYSYYLKNMDFLSSKNILYFTDRDGTLMALKPDITLSIIKNLDTAVDKHKLYYSENVYRAPNASGNFQEILQFGVEVIGRLSDEDMFSLIFLAAISLLFFDDQPVLLVSDNSIFQKLIEIAGLGKAYSRVFAAFQNKNLMLLEEILAENNTDQKYREILIRLLSLHLPLKKGIEELENLLDDEDFSENMAYLKGLYRYLEDRGLKTEVYLDFSAPEGLRYYDRISFVGIIPGASSEVLRGGEYSNLVKTKDASYLASGFAIYLEKIEDKGSL
ncbi:MAG: ATP phosphoribosyltransferase regulatory subunit [Bacillota bacterium]|nr:ATP phosphoribosyltransferase regulatory subunit [Bacillota bacterium]